MQKYRSIKVNAILNTTKQICMIIFPIITFPFASRVLGTFYFGKVNFGASIISYITLIAGLGISNYAIREGAKLRDERGRLQTFCNEVFSINIVSTIFSYLLLIVVIVSWDKLDGYTTLLLIQSLSVLFTTIGTDWINSIFEDYLYITLRYIISQFVSVALMLLLVRSEEDYLIYAFATVSGVILANIMNVFYIKKKYMLKVCFTFGINIKKHMKPILLLFGNALAISVYINADILLLGILKGEHSVGLYGAASKIYLLVKQVLNAMLIVTVPRISHEVENKNYKIINQQLEAVLGDLLTIIGPAVVGLFMLAENIIVLFSEVEFIQASGALRVLSFAMLPATLACFCTSAVLIPFGKEKIVLISTIVSATSNIVLNFLLIPYWGEYAAAFTTLISELIMMVMGILFCNNLIHVRMRKSVLVGVINTIVTFFCCHLIGLLNLGNFFTILLSMVTAIICVMGVLMLVDRKRIISVWERFYRRIKH